MSFSALGQWTFGIKGSIVRSSQDISPVLTYVGYDNPGEKINGFGTTAFLYYRVLKHLQIGIEPGLVRRGNRTINYMTVDASPFDCWDYELDHFKECDVEAYNENRVYASYVQAPIFLKGTLPICKDRLAIFAKAGSGFAWLVAAQTERGNNDLFGIPAELSTFNLKEADFIERWDLAWQMGTGIDLKMGPGYLTLESIFYHGTKDFYSYTKSLTKSFEYSLGYQINL